MIDSRESRLRLFYAVIPDPVSREHIALATEAICLEPGARRVPSENYHMTLAFVGDVAASRLPELQGVGDAQKARAFSVIFGQCEYWPKSGVIVATARIVPDELQRLWRQLRGELAGHGWVLAAERLRPHVTLARKVSQPPVLQAMSACEWRARDFSLVRSDTSGVQSAYTVVDTWPLLDGVEKA